MVLPTERGVLCVKCVCLSGGIFHNRTKPMKIWGLGFGGKKRAGSAVHAWTNKGSFDARGKHLLVAQE